MLRLDGPPAWHRRCAERRAGRALYGPGLDYGGSSVTAVKHKSEQRDLSSKNCFPRLILAENCLRLSEQQPHQQPQIYIWMEPRADHGNPYSAAAFHEEEKKHNPSVFHRPTSAPRLSIFFDNFE